MDVASEASRAAPATLFEQEPNARSAAIRMALSLIKTTIAVDFTLIIAFPLKQSLLEV